MLDHFRLACYRFHLKVIDEMPLPAYKGAVLRGGFGSVFKHTVCCQRHYQVCEPCALRHVCPYPLLFEPSPPPGSEALRTHEAIPRPFVLEPPQDSRRLYAPGDELFFGLTLVGKATHYLPSFIVAFLRLGELGLGRKRARHVLQRGEAVHHPTGRIVPIYEKGTLLAEGQESVVSYTEIAQAVNTENVDRLTLHFLTPTRLKYNGRYVEEAPAFHVVVRTLLRRVSSLSYFHCGQRWETDYRGWIEQAQEVETVAAEVRWVDWERYSSRQRRRMNLGGIVGRVTYSGELARFLPLLRLGELIHVGKGAVFGNGQYEMEIGD